MISFIAKLNRPRGLFVILRLLNSAIQDGAIAKAMVCGSFNKGFCTICDDKTIFVKRTAWLRDNYFCVSCFSIPRQRAIIHVLQTQFPNWRSLTIHESSSDGESSKKLLRECAGYTSSQFFPDIEMGKEFEGVRCENLERLTFPNDSFDLVITQDVMEHVLDPARAFAEIGRVLKPGGAHVFTVPIYDHETSVARALRDESGEIQHLLPPDYHGDPSVGAGWLVATEWGTDLAANIEAWSSMTTQVFAIEDAKLGLLGEFPEVLVSRRADF